MSRQTSQLAQIHAQSSDHNAAAMARHNHHWVAVLAWVSGRNHPTNDDANYSFLPSKSKVMRALSFELRVFAVMLWKLTKFETSHTSQTSPLRLLATFGCAWWDDVCVFLLCLHSAAMHEGKQASKNSGWKMAREEKKFFKLYTQHF